MRESVRKKIEFVEEKDNNCFLERNIAY